MRLFSEGLPSAIGPASTDQPPSLAALAGTENDSPSRQIARFIKEIGERFVPGFKVALISRRDRYGRGGDHIPFLQRGFPAVRFTEPNEEFRRQHQNVRVENGFVYGDLPQYVDYAYVARVARVNAAALAMMALAPPAPAEVEFVTRRLSHDTELRWKAPPGQEPAGYEIVWRATTEPVWTHRRAVGNDTHAVIPGVSKDNFYFGVRSRDHKGNQSPVAFPQPPRLSGPGAPG